MSAGVIAAARAATTAAAGATKAAIAAVTVATTVIAKALTAGVSAFVFLDFFYELLIQTRHASKTSTQHVEALTPPQLLILADFKKECNSLRLLLFSIFF